jgi:hypothetical protein
MNTISICKRVKVNGADQLQQIGIFLERMDLPAPLNASVFDMERP